MCLARFKFRKISVIIFLSFCSDIQICNVKPISEPNPLFEGVSPCDLPDKIASFYEVNDVRRFQFDRPIYKGPVDKENEFKVQLFSTLYLKIGELYFVILYLSHPFVFDQSLWLERTTLVTGSSLPGILRWFEVVERTVEEITPVQFACETMETVNRELRQLISQYEQDSKRNINPFTMRLQVTFPFVHSDDLLSHVPPF